MAEALSVELVRHATGVIGVEGGAIGPRRARGGEVPERRGTVGPANTARLPQIRADERLGAMLERLLYRNHDHRSGLLPIDSETPLEDWVDADPGPAVDPVGLVRAGDQEDQSDARVLHEILQTIYSIVATSVGDQQCAAVVGDLNEARLVAFGRAVEPMAAPCRQDKKWRAAMKARPIAST